MKLRGMALMAVLMAAAVAALAGCGGSSTGGATTSSNSDQVRAAATADTNGYFMALPTEDEFTPYDLALQAAVMGGGPDGGASGGQPGPGQINNQPGGQGPGQNGQPGVGPGGQGPGMGQGGQVGPGQGGPGQRPGMPAYCQNPELSGAPGPRAGINNAPVALPYWYRRTELPPSRNMDVVREGDTSALVTVSSQADYTFYIDVDGDCTFGEKAASHEAARQARLVSTEQGRWQISEITISEVSMKDNALDTLQIASVAFEVAGQELWRATDPARFYNVSTGLAALDPGVQVKLIVEAANPAGSLKVFLRNGAFERGHQRLELKDDGAGADAVAGDGKYTALLRVPPARGIGHVGVEVMDAAAFADETSDNYRARGWMVPYRVLAPVDGIGGL